MTRRALGVVLLLAWVVTGAAWPSKKVLRVFERTGASPAELATVTSGYSIYVIGDTHWAWGLLGCGEVGRRNLLDAVKYINNDPTAAALVVTGDFAHFCFQGTEGYAADKWAPPNMPVQAPAWVDTQAESLRFIDSVNVVFKDTLLVPVYPVVGNWEWSKLRRTPVTPGTTAAGQPFDSIGALDNGRHLNDFTLRYPEFFASFVSSPDNRGRRHYGERVRTRSGAPTNFILYTFYNVNEADPATDYWGNTPATGYDPNSRFGRYDFDGYHDSTSTQRVDFKTWLASSYTAGDWLAIAGHRPFKTFENLNRQADDTVWSRGHGMANWMKAWINGKDIQRYLMLAGDTHENLWFKHPTAKYLQIHSTVALRNMENIAQIADSGWTASEMLFWSYADTSGTAAVNTLRQANPAGSWITLTRIHILSANSARLDAIVFLRNPSTYALLDSTIKATATISRTS